MTREELIPEDPVGFIRRRLVQRKILWTYHINIRMKGRSISRRAIVDSHESFEVIEQYPKDKSHPSYLVRSGYKREVLHILFALDMKADNIRVITAYRPILEEWEDGFRIRRKSS